MALLAPWALANPLSIQRDGEGEVWHAGRCVDMLALGGGELLVATDTGGVWSIDGAYDATPQSDIWESPDMECLALGPLGPNHVLAGARGALYETDPARTNVAGAPAVYRWRQIGLPNPVSTVHRIAVTDEPPRVVIATNAGVWWALADGTGNYDWKPAGGVPADAFYGLARTSAGVIAGVGFPRLGAQGIFHGDWQGADLVLSPSAYGPPPPFGGPLPEVDVASMRQVSLACCRTKPERAYAIAADPSGKILCILASSDGGVRWRKRPTKFAASYTGKDEFISFFGDAGAGGWQKTISVHPDDPDRVAFSWLRACLSSNGGSTWTPIGGDWNPANGLWEYFPEAQGLHEDTHLVYFDDSYGAGRIYVLSDGGLARSDDGRKFQSAPNRNLANLQFLSPQVQRDFWGTLGIAPFAPLLGGGLQDNGNVWCHFDPAAAPTPWLEFEAGDGGWVAFLDHYQQQMLGHTSDQVDGDPTRRYVWNAQSRGFDDKDKVPLLTRFGWIDKDGIKDAIGERVARPRTGSLKVLYAVAAGRVTAAAILDPPPLELEGQDIDNRVLFGLYGNNVNDYLVWEEVGELPVGTKPITAVGPDTRGDLSFVGTEDGRIFSVENDGTVLELGVEDPPTGRGRINRIVSDGVERAFAIMDSPGGGYVLQLATLEWKLLRSTTPVPYTTLFSLDINRGHGAVKLAVATDREVYVTPDFGDNWFDASGSLPNVHCSDLRFTQAADTTTLFLSTYGRSVWAAGVAATDG